MKPEDAAEYFLSEYENNVFYNVKPSVELNNLDAITKYLSILDLSNLKDYNIIGVEKKIRTSIDEIEIVGFIDLLLEHKLTKDIIIIDHKSSKYPLGKNEQPLKNYIQKLEMYKKQMYIYSFAIKEEYGKYPKLICWNHFKDGKVVKIPFDIKEFENTIVWLKGLVSIISREQHFAPIRDYFYCHNLCDFRNSCEYCEVD